MSPRPEYPVSPLVGRASELSQLGRWLDGIGKEQHILQIVAGASGIGKTRLLTAVADRAAHDGWTVAIGRVYAVESGIPYAVWSDALLPLLRSLDATTLNILTRGGQGWLASICPAFTTASSSEDGGPEGKARLLWNCAQFLSRLAEKKPLLLVLENLHLADAASLELLHFVARQSGRHRLAIIGSYAENDVQSKSALREMEQSLIALGAADVMRLAPLTQTNVEQLVCEAFNVDKHVTRQLTERLYAWTHGHAFFVDETLKALVASGRLHQRDGQWLGWEVEELDLPRSVRSSVSGRLERLTPNARTVANSAAVLGTRVTFEMLCTLAALPREAVLEAIDELRLQGVLVESADVDSVRYEIAHPIMADVIYSELGATRARILHGRVAETLEAEHARDASSPSDAIAFHYARAEPGAVGAKAVTYLAAAGRDALARHADRAAADYLAAALERLPSLADASAIDAETLVDDLAQARQRLGEYDAAMALWQRARVDAESRGNPARLARVERRMGLACYWSGRYDEALAHFDAALSAAVRAGDDAFATRIQLNRSTCFQSTGRGEEAQRELQSALQTAERLGDESLLARTHRALLFLHSFIGPADTAREHGERAVQLAEQHDELTVAWSAHWGLSMLSGLTGDAAGTVRHIQRGEQIADQVQSPLLRIWIDELSIEYSSGTGNWDAGLALAERTIATARSLNQRTLIPRVLVWAALFYSARGQFERAKQYLDEAWELVVSRSKRDRPTDVHSQVPVHVGRAFYHMVREEYSQAVEVGEAGLAIADRSGYVTWTIHRLIPVIAESALYTRDIAHAVRLNDRLRRDSARLGHRLGLAWAGAGDGLVARLEGDLPRAAELLSAAADNLERIPWVYDAARLRRFLADTLLRIDEKERGLRELRKSHDICARLSAEVELGRAREMMRVLGVRLPPRTVSAGAGTLTAREMDIARLVSAGKSNKEIGAALGIATRTVSTHVANIFTKLDVSSRTELSSMVRSGAPRLPDPSEDVRRSRPSLT